MMHQTMMSFRQDPDAVKGKKIERAAFRRVLRWARPYRRQLIWFLLMVILAAVVGALRHSSSGRC